MLATIALAALLVPAISPGAVSPSPAAGFPARASALSDVDRALAAFWAAESPEEAEAAVEGILETDADFELLFQKLARGRTYSSKVPVGRFEASRTNRDGLLHRYVVRVPMDYDPVRKYPVRFFLHGGTTRPPWKENEDWARFDDRLLSDEVISVFPAAWNESFWWQESQLENLAGILDNLKRTYNVDENRIYLLGVSDGGSGIYYHALRSPTPWAAFLPFIGIPSPVANPMKADADFHLPNLTNRSFLVINTERDPLYPPPALEPWVQLFQAAGVDLDFRTVADFGHEMTWWPQEEPRIEAFIRTHVRDPLPDRIAWETETTDRFQRFHWLTIDDLGPARDDVTFDDVSARKIPHRKPYGRLELEKEGNRVVVRSSGVRSFRLLISPHHFDLDEPIRVVVNGRTYFDGIVRPDAETLLRWSARDNDRTMAFAAEVKVQLPPEPRPEERGPKAS